MLGGDDEARVLAADVQSAVGPGVEVTRAAQSLAQAAAGLAGVMHDDDGDVVSALQLAQEGEQGGDLGGAVLVDAVQAYEGPDARPSQCRWAHRLGQDQERQRRELAPGSWSCRGS